MHQALYRKWRPSTFDEVCGQEHITDILKYEIDKGLICHAYLFCGSRGTGKTTCAKILARAVNCEHPVNGSPCGECGACRTAAAGMTTDILEMDAASNNKVDDIRTILDEVVYTPSSMKYRVYIIDEVHMLSVSAFNALLKTLEEPPAHVIFILATTEMQKLPATIVSRCQRFDFHRIRTGVLRDRLKYIAGEESIRLDDDAALILARLAQGGMRDAISLFELCAAGGRDVTAEVVSQTVGSCGREKMSACVRAISSRDCAALFDMIAEIDASAKDIGVFWQELIGYYRDMLVMRTVRGSAAVKYLDLTDAESEMLAADAALFRRETLSYHCKLLDEAYSAMQRPGASRRTVAELTLVRLSDEKLDTSQEALVARISALEAAIAMGAASASFGAPSSVSDFDAPPLPEDAPPDPEAPDFSAPAPAHTPVSAPAPASGKTGQPAAPAGQPRQAPDVPRSAPAAAQPGQRVLRPLRQWTEILEGFRSSNPGVASMLQTEKAYTDDAKPGAIVICYTKKLTRMLVEAPETMRALCSSASLVMERPFDASRVIFEEVPAGAAAPSDAKILIDELSALADADANADGRG